MIDSRICGRQYEERRIRQYRSVLLLLRKSFLVLIVSCSRGSAGVPDNVSIKMVFKMTVSLLVIIGNGGASGWHLMEFSPQLCNNAAV